jgi:hypothetical protein
VEADIAGSQRKVVTSEVRPARTRHGDAGIPLRRTQTLAFVVRRAWSAPAGVYPEQWFLVQPETREVLYESPVTETLIWGLQSLTEINDEVTESMELQPGNYLVVFALGGLMGGDMHVEAFEVPAEAAA